MSAKMKEIRSFFVMGMSYREIQCFITFKYGISISMRHLKRLLNKDGLYRRKRYSDISEVIHFIENELKTSGQLHGYRWMHHKCIQSGFVVQKEYVRIILQLLDPSGVSRRRKRKLKRREYISRGPNYIWHLDSYDKLKPFGICVNGCIDGFSRHIIWMEAGRTNSDPNIIGGYFCQAILNTGGVPCILRGDLGTENCLVAEMQTALSSRFIYGTSQHNQRIEAWWGILRKENAQFWMSIFEDIKADGFFSGDLLDKNLIQFCFLNHIKEELVDVVNEWNTHRIRKHSGGDGGRPVTLYNLPEIYDTYNYLRLLDREELELCEEISNIVDDLPCDQDVFELATLYMGEMNLQSPADAYDAANLYRILRNNIRSDLY